MPNVLIPPVSPDRVVPGRFEGRVLLVTGAADGIGGATAIRAAREGARVVGGDGKVAALQVTVARINAEASARSGGEPPRALAVGADVSVTADADRVVEETVRTYGRIDLALN